MVHRLLADAVLVLHAAFIAFVLLGGLGALRWRWWPWLHGPAAAWGVYIEVSGRLCPLTTLENTLRRHAGDSGYPGGFIEHHLWPLIYPEGLTRPTQFVLAVVVVLVNAVIYGLVLRRRRRGA
jgi:Protein of Unknown function (DUF2784)